MIRTLNYIFLACLAIVLLTVALANRDAVTLSLLPADMAAFIGWGWTLSLPLYLVIFGSIVAGLMIGFLWEFFREHKYRANSRMRAREIARLERELGELRTMQGAAPGKSDDVLALLERPAKAG